MNLIIFGLILLCSNVWAKETNVATQGLGDQLFENFLKRFKTILKTGNDTLGIPILDPFISEQQKIKLNEKIIKMDALLTNINIKGLSEYNIVTAKFDIFQYNLSLHLQWPLVTADTNYSIKGKIDMLDIFGNGNIKMSAKNFAFQTNINFILEGGLGGYLKISNMTLKLFLDSLDLHVTGLYDNDEISKILSVVISEMAPELITDKTVVHEIYLLVRKQLDTFLSNTKLMDLLKWIL